MTVKVSIFCTSEFAGAVVVAGTFVSLGVPVGEAGLVWATSDAAAPIPKNRESTALNFHDVWRFIVSYMLVLLRANATEAVFA